MSTRAAVYVYLTLALVGLVRCNAEASDRRFLAVAVTSAAATAVDVESTVRCIDRGRCVEVNPIMRPAVGSRWQAHTLSQGLNGASLTGAWWLKKRGVKWWWLVPAVSTGLHVVAGARNR